MSAGKSRTLSKEQIKQLDGDPTKPLQQDASETRSAAAQIDALLSLTDKRVRNIEASCSSMPPSKDELREMRSLAELLATLVRAQRDIARADEDSFDPEKEARKRMEKDE